MDICQGKDIGSGTGIHIGKDIGIGIDMGVNFDIDIGIGRGIDIDIQCLSLLALENAQRISA